MFWTSHGVSQNIPATCLVNYSRVVIYAGENGHSGSVLVDFQRGHPRIDGNRIASVVVMVDPDPTAYLKRPPTHPVHVLRVLDEGGAHDLMDQIVVGLGHEGTGFASRRASRIVSETLWSHACPATILVSS